MHMLQMNPAKAPRDNWRSSSNISLIFFDLFLSHCSSCVQHVFLILERVKALRIIGVSTVSTLFPRPCKLSGTFKHVYRSEYRLMLPLWCLMNEVMLLLSDYPMFKYDSSIMQFLQFMNTLQRNSGNSLVKLVTQVSLHRWCPSCSSMYCF
jgi:hypothetical protein